ncbi:28S ribosomal protein S31, mitochondrial [Vanessa cardui]|uniref:28S ribosomal protein S31, mitochondrial n=1 Tax=Vanessa cardui TaxID=171605 RepID=UPI001F144D02|nr:28S ribosomal protein S31, mitochondrial [Vanessa cardui]
MLSRLRIKRDLKYFVRCLADKPPSDHDGKISEIKTKDSKEQNKSTESSTEKIQALLKLMMSEPKISESEYREKFATAPERQKKPKPDVLEVKMEKIEESITKAASDVAQAIGGDVKQTEAELLSKVLGKINQTSTSLSDLIVGMKVDRSRDSDETVTKETRGQQVKRLMKTREGTEDTRYSQRKQKTTFEKKRSLPQPLAMDVFSGEPLGIFKTKQENYGTKLDVWDHLSQRELLLATSQPPANYFQKMIQWTEQGKVWKFPIDNEQGIEEEQNVHFSEHIFLDAHLEGWCPTKGPIRHFMELVCVGLSKNAFYTVKEKRDHIMWYKEYFESKQDILTDIGVWETQPTSEAAT